MTSSFRKVFWPALVAMALFAAIGFSASKTEAVAPSFAGDGDICATFSTTGSQARVNEVFWGLGRVQDAFQLEFKFLQIGPNPHASPNSFAWAGYWFVTDDEVTADVDDQDGNMNIIGKADDGFKVHDFTWTAVSALVELVGWGHVDINATPSVDHISDLDIIAWAASDGGDPDDSDLLEFFPPASLADATAMINFLLGECGNAQGNGFLLSTAIDCFILQDPLSCAALPAGGEIQVNMDGLVAVALTCTEPGSSRLTFDPETFIPFNSVNFIEDNGGAALLFAPGIRQAIDFALQDNPEPRALDIECIGGAHSASSAVSPASIEVSPVGINSSTSVVTVTVLDQNGRRVDGVNVTFTTDECRISASATGPWPSGQTTVSTPSDTDTSGDTAFVAAHNAAGDELFAGTAEAYVDCRAAGTTPTNNNILVTYVVDGNASGTGLQGTQTITVVGKPTTLTLTATPTTSTCGSAVTVTASVVDSLGTNVSDGTLVFFTGPNDVGITGGGSSAQGGIATSAGKASVIVSPGQGLANGTSTITISAITGGNDLNGSPVAQVQNSITITCSGPTVSAPAAPNVTVPNTGTGAIRPPNTGDAGLVADNGSSWSLFAVAGLVAFAVAGLASVKFARR